jgi:hypothetical protein
MMSDNLGALDYFAASLTSLYPFVGVPSVYGLKQIDGRQAEKKKTLRSEAVYCVCCFYGRS